MEEVKLKQEVILNSVHKKVKKVDVPGLSDRLYKDSIIRNTKMQIKIQEKIMREEAEL
jgi:hypothetical protein